MSFQIKAGYVENSEPHYFPDVNAYGIVSQPLVYPLAALLAKGNRARTLIDLGCGRADKLAKVRGDHRDWSFVGIDYGKNIRYCRAQYDWGEWIDWDLERPYPLEARDAVIVCADVIEHLQDPRALLATIRDSGCSAAVISTPERDLTWGKTHAGPPPNECHVREWNRTELKAFLKAEGLKVRSMGLTASDDAGSGDKTILAVAE